MTKATSNKIDISDIKFFRDENKQILDTPDKIIRWIKYKFEEQESSTFAEPINHYIDLSNSIISTTSHNGNPSMTNLCDIIKENRNNKSLDCFITNGYSNNYYQEVLEKVFCRNSLIYSAFFHNTKFHKEVDFEGSEFKGYASFGHCCFKKNANFQNTIYTGNFDFDNCIFIGRVLFNKAKFDVYQVHFDYSIFKDRFVANRIEFINDEIKNENRNIKPFISFCGTEFQNELKLSNINFTRECNFIRTKFESNVEFFNSDFKTSILFNNAQINGNILFTVNDGKDENAETNTSNTIKKACFNHSSISGRIDIERCQIDEFEGFFTEIKSSAILRICESFVKSLDLTSIHNNGTLILEDNKTGIEKITLKSAINTGLIEVDNTNIQIIVDRKTARLLKDSALKSGNTIDALEFRKKEMELLESEIVSRDSKRLLWLNRVSNNHGTSWVRGLFFTFICSTVFYLFFLIISRLDGIYSLFTSQSVTWTLSLDFSNGIKYLWSLDFLDTLHTWVKNTDFQVIWWILILKLIYLIIGITVYIIGKITIAYGIYQTII